MFVSNFPVGEPNKNKRLLRGNQLRPSCGGALRPFLSSARATKRRVGWGASIRKDLTFCSPSRRPRPPASNALKALTSPRGRGRLDGEQNFSSRCAFSKGTTVVLCDKACVPLGFAPQHKLSAAWGFRIFRLLSDSGGGTQKEDPIQEYILRS